MFRPSVTSRHYAPRYGEKERASADTPPLQLLLATLTHLKKPYQLLVIPLTMWSGFEQAFIMADFSKVRNAADI